MAKKKMNLNNFKSIANFKNEEELAETLKSAEYQSEEIKGNVETRIVKINQDYFKLTKKIGSDVWESAVAYQYSNLQKASEFIQRTSKRAREERLKSNSEVTQKNRKRIQSGIHFTKPVFDILSTYVDALNDYIISCMTSADAKDAFKAKYKTVPKKIKLADLTDNILFNFLDKNGLIGVSKIDDDFEDLLPLYEEGIEYSFQDILEAISYQLLEDNYKDIPKIALLNAEQHKRSLYVNDDILADLAVAGYSTFGVQFGDKTTLLNQVLMDWFNANNITVPINFFKGHTQIPPLHYQAQNPDLLKVKDPDFTVKDFDVYLKMPKFTDMSADDINRDFDNAKFIKNNSQKIEKLLK